MRYLFLALLLAVGQAQAQFEYILPCTGTGGPLPTPTPAKPPGMPAQVKAAPGVAVCGPYIVGSSTAGMVAGYWCQSSPDATPRPVLGAAEWSAIPGLLLDLASIPLAADQQEAARLLQAKHQTTNFYNMCHVWGDAGNWRERFNAAMPAVRPPPTTTWQTPATGTGTIYRAAGTKLGAVVVGKKAPASTPCNASVTPIMYYGGAFLPLASGPVDEVTLCRQVTQ